MKHEQIKYSKKRERFNDQDIGLIFVGKLVPDLPFFHNRGFSRAGHLFQKGIIKGLISANLIPSCIISARPIPSFPTSRELWVGSNPKVSVEGIEINFLRFINITPIKQLMIGLGTIIKIISWALTTNFQQRVVYTYNLSVPPGLFTLIGAKLIGAKTFVSINDVDVPGQTVPKTILTRMDFFLQKLIIPKFDGHIVVTDEIMKDFAPSKSYVRIDGGISKDILRKTESPTRGDGSRVSAFRVFFAGSLDEANGIIEILDAFKIIEENHIHLNIAGRGPLEPLVKNSAEEDPRICFLGYISFDEVLDMYKNSDLLINMRITEEINTKYFFPSKVMEYLTSGIPVLSTKTGHLEEEYGAYCFLLDKDTPESLAKAIQKIASLDEKTREMLGENARIYMKNEKTWEAQGEKIKNYIYQTMHLE